MITYSIAMHDLILAFGVLQRCVDQVLWRAAIDGGGLRGNNEIVTRTNH